MKTHDNNVLLGQTRAEIGIARGEENLEKQIFWQVGQELLKSRITVKQKKDMAARLSTTTVKVGKNMILREIDDFGPKTEEDYNDEAVFGNSEYHYDGKVNGIKIPNGMLEKKLYNFVIKKRMEIER
ncbi:MAG: hypothetical protein LBH92_01410 [Bacteroidales bacterium]|jgi:hypothetical protein|nr:hypothetical protein [Bacteroidales bacterium]